MFLKFNLKYHCSYQVYCYCLLHVDLFVINLIYLDVASTTTVMISTITANACSYSIDS